MTRGQKAILIAGALLVLAMGFLWRSMEPPAPPPPEPKASAPLSAIPKATGGVGSAIPRKSVSFAPAEDRPEPEFDPYEDWPLEKILDNFMIPPGRFYAENLREAINGLSVIYDQHGGKNGLSFQQLTHFDPERSIALDHGNISFRGLLDLVAALGGASTLVEGDIITFGPVDNAGQEVHSQITAGGNIGNVDPLEGSDVLYQFDPASYFRDQFDVEIPDSVRIDRNLDTASWEIVGPAESVVVVEALVAAQMGEQSPNALITQKLISTPPGMFLEPQSLTEPHFQQLIRRVVQADGVSLLSTPSVLSTPGHEAAVEVRRLVHYRAEHESPSLEATQVGFRIPITPVLSGLEGVRLSGAAEFTTLADDLHQSFGGPSDGIDFQGGVGAEDFQSYATDFEGELVDGDTALIEVARTPDGSAIYQFLTTRRILRDEPANP